MTAAGMIGFAMLYLAVQPGFGTWHGWLFTGAFLLMAGLTVVLLFRIRGSGG